MKIIQLIKQPFLRFLRIDQLILKIDHLISQTNDLSREIAILRTDISKLVDTVDRIDHALGEAEDRERDIVIMLDRMHGSSRDKLDFHTQYPVASESADHQFPRGTVNDNTRHPRFVNKVGRIFGHPVAHLDLGCSGGGLVWDFLLEGHRSYGIEGSDFSLLTQRAEWRLLRNNLFTADITRPFYFTDVSNKPFLFDIMTAWEVLEHIPEQKIGGLVRNIKENLAPGGMFVASVATFEDKDDATGVVWHVTIRDKAWWSNVFVSAGFELIHGIFVTADFVRGSGNRRALYDWNADANPELGFHLVVRKPAQV